MFTSINQFTTAWKFESEATLRLLSKLTDDSLARPQMDQVRTVGRAAWHIVTTLPEMAGRIGITIPGLDHTAPVPSGAAAIVEAYRAAAASVLESVKQWPDSELQKEDDMYGQMWKRGASLWGMMVHEIHHRGQLTVLMRLAELPVIGVYGPAKEEWQQYGSKPPEV